MASSTETRSSAIRSRTRSSNASTRKWPLPQQGIENAQGRGFNGPIGEGASGGSPRARPLVAFVLFTGGAHEAHVGEVVATPRIQTHQPPKFLLVGGIPRHIRAIGQNPAHAPRADGVVQEEQHHVVLGEQLGDGRQFVGADLPLLPIDLLLPLGLPELVGPAERIRGLEHGCGQLIQQPFEFLPRLWGEGEFQHRIVPAENLREHSFRAPRRELPGIHTLAVCQFPAVFQRQVDTVLRVSEKSVLGQKTGEEHAVPVLVGHLMDEMIDTLGALLPIELVSSLPASHPKAVA